MKKIISGIQQLGVGIPNVQEAWKWYRKHFGMDIPMVDEAGTAERMLRYTDNKPQERHAIIAVNIQGGGGFEIWQYMSREPQAPNFEVKLGDLGICVGKVKSKTLNASFLNFKAKEERLMTNIMKSPDENEHFFVQDPYKNIFQVVNELVELSEL